MFEGLLRRKKIAMAFADLGKQNLPMFIEEEH